MKNLLILVTLGLSINSFAQKKELNLTAKDSIPLISYKDTNTKEKAPAYFLNGKHINENVLKSIDLKKIASLNVQKDSLVIGDKIYYGSIQVETNDDYNPRLITLNYLNENHIKLPNEKHSVLFFLDEEIIDADYNDYLIDINNILKIEVQYIDNINGIKNIKIINLLTKSDKNLREHNKIIIR